MIFIFLCLTTSFSMSTSRSIHVVNGIISLFFMTEYYSIVIHTIKDFSLVNEAEVDFFFYYSLAFSMIQWMLAI